MANRFRPFPRSAHILAVDLRERISFSDACKQLRAAGWRIELVMDRIQLRNKRPHMVQAIAIGSDYMVSLSAVRTWVKAYSEW